LIDPSYKEENVNEDDKNAFPLLVFENDQETILDMSRYMAFPLSRVVKEFGINKTTLWRWLKKYCPGRVWGYGRVKEINRHINALTLECQNLNKKIHRLRFKDRQQRKLKLLKEKRALLEPARVKLTPKMSTKLRQRFKPKIKY
jgi:transposase-like protein